ncbi:MAG: hypothetical protein WBM78_00260 [Desulfobacterales bacterium]
MTQNLCILSSLLAVSRVVHLVRPVYAGSLNRPKSACLIAARMCLLPIAGCRITSVTSSKKKKIYSLQRSYYATRALVQYGFNVKNISGGFKTFLLHESSQFLG